MVFNHLYGHHNNITVNCSIICKEKINCTAISSVFFCRFLHRKINTLLVKKQKEVIVLFLSTVNVKPQFISRHTDLFSFQ